MVTALFLLALVVTAAGWASFHPAVQTLWLAASAGARSWAWDQIAIFARLIPRGSAAPFRIVCLVIEPGLLMGTACAGGYLGFHAAFEDQLLDFRLEVAS